MATAKAVCRACILFDADTCFLTLMNCHPQQK
jgi:hypothetical protein